MKVQVTHTITRAGKRIVTKGDIITMAQAIKKDVVKYTIPVTRVHYSAQDFRGMSQTYINNPEGTLGELVETFLKDNRDTKANASGLTMYFSIIRGLDNTTHYEGLDNPSQTLVMMLQEQSPERFA